MIKYNDTHKECVTYCGKGGYSSYAEIENNF